MFMNCIKIQSGPIKPSKIRVKVSGKDQKYKTQKSLAFKPDKNRSYHQSEIFDTEPKTAKNKTTARIASKTKKIYATNTKPNFNKSNKKAIHKTILSAYDTSKGKFEFKESKMKISQEKNKTNNDSYRKPNSLKYTITEPGLLKKFNQVVNKSYMRSGSMNPKANNNQSYGIDREMAFIRTNSIKQNNNNYIKKNMGYENSYKNKTSKKIVKTGKMNTINNTTINNKKEAKKIKKPYINLDNKENKPKINQKLFNKMLDNPKEPKESKDYNKSVNIEILNIEDFDKTNNDSTISNNHINNKVTSVPQNSDYTGFLLIKQIKGKNVLEIKFPDSNINEINKILESNNFLINNKPTLLIHADGIRLFQNIKDENKRLTEENYKIMEEYEEIRTELFTLKLEEGKIQPESSENNIYTPDLSQVGKNEELKDEDLYSNNKDEEDSIELETKDNVEDNLGANLDDNSNYDHKNSSSNLGISNKSSNKNGKMKEIQNKIAEYKNKLKSNFRMTQKLVEKRDRKNSSFDDQQFEKTNEQLGKVDINRSSTKKSGFDFKNSIKKNSLRESGIMRRTMNKRSNKIILGINNQEKNNLGKITKKDSNEVTQKRSNKNVNVTSSSNNRKIETQEKKEKAATNNTQDKIGQKSTKDVPKMEKKSNKTKYRQSIKIMGLAKQLEDMIKNMNTNKDDDSEDSDSSSSEKEDDIIEGNVVELIQEIPIQKKGRKKPKKSVIMSI